MADAFDELLMSRSTMSWWERTSWTTDGSFRRKNMGKGLSENRQSYTGADVISYEVTSALGDFSGFSALFLLFPCLVFQVFLHFGLHRAESFEIVEPGVLHRQLPVPCLQGVDDVFMFRVGVGSSGVPDGEDGFKQHIVFGLKFKCSARGLLPAR